MKHLFFTLISSCFVLFAFSGKNGAEESIEQSATSTEPYSQPLPSTGWLKPEIKVVPPPGAPGPHDVHIPGQNNPNTPTQNPEKTLIPPLPPLPPLSDHDKKVAPQLVL